MLSVAKNMDFTLLRTCTIKPIGEKRTTVEYTAWQCRHVCKRIMMLDSIPADIQAWVAKHTGPIQAAQKLKGGISTSVYRVTTTKSDYVLRVIDNAEWLAEEPDLVLHEAAALQQAAQFDIATPELVAYDDAQECAIPALLMTWLPGEMQLQPDNLRMWLRELAHTLATIHTVDVPEFKWVYRPWFDVQKFSPPDWSKYLDLWQEAAAILHQSPPDTPLRFIHRDYHPANVLWQKGHINGVFDWMTSCRGPVSVDVSICRTDLVGLYGVEASNQFLRDYEAATGFQHHPYWDLCGLLDLFYHDTEIILAVWHDLGVTALTAQQIYGRADAYLQDVMARVSR